MPKASKSLLCVLLIAAVFSTLTFAATPDRITGALTAGQTVALRGNVHHKALPDFDRGPADPGLRFGSITLLTVPTPSQQKALTRLLAEQQDPRSSNYRKWLTPEQWADRFGLSPNDVQKITAWLKQQGFGNIHVARGRNWFMFSGTAAQVESAFGTEIRRFEVNGEMHVANATSPKIPTALAGIVTGVRGLDDFHLRPRAIGRTRPYYYNSTYNSLAAPGDIATIYDINPLYKATTPIDGTGQKLAVIGQTDIYLADLNDFRSGFNLSTISTTDCSTNASGVITSCNDPLLDYVFVPTGHPDPGVPLTTGDVTEADVDLEWSGAVARNAQIVYVNAPATFSGSTLVSGGVWAAWYDAVDNDRAPVISMSYGLCEFGFIYDISSTDEIELKKANTLGITFVNSTGDSGSAECDPNNYVTNPDPYGASATGGLAVSYPASSPEVTGVGGTAVPLADFTTTYWGTTNGTDGGTALSYVPEQAWNDDAEIAQFCQQNSGNLFCTQGGSKAVKGWVAITNAQTAQQDIGIYQTGGGPSNCATQDPTFSYCVSGFPQPSWQTVTISGQTSARFSPDVSFLATPNFPGYIFCTQLSELGDSGSGSACANGIANALGLNTPPIIGGTSVSAPVFAGIVTLLNQYLAGPSSPGLGNVNPTLYQLAATPANGAFNQVKTGNNQVYCSPGTPGSPQPSTLDCPSPPATAVLGFLASSADTATGYNLVTGLGSVNVNNLAVAWAATRSSTTTLISPASAQVYRGAIATFTASVTPSTATGTVSFYDNGSTTALGSATLSGGTATFTTSTLPVGTNNVTAAYNGDGYNDPSTSAAPSTVTVIVPFTLSSNNSTVSVKAGHTDSSTTITVNPADGFNQALTFSCSAGLPAGATCTFTPNSTTQTSVNLSISTIASMGASSGAVTVQATTGGTNPVMGATALTLTVTATDQSFSLKPQNATYQVLQGQSVNATINLTASSGFNTPVTYTCSDQASESSCTGPSGPTTQTSVSFLITTTAPTTRLQRPFDRTTIFYAVLMPGLLGIVFTFGSRKRSLRSMRMLGLIMVLGCSTLWLGSCGGNNSSQKNPGTPKGSYTINVNATTGGANPVTAPTSFTLQVN